MLWKPQTKLKQRVVEKKFIISCYITPDFLSLAKDAARQFFSLKKDRSPAFAFYILR